MSYREIEPNLAGIYIIKNNVNGKCYIGQSVNLRSRIKDHIRNAKDLKIDLPIYRAIKKHGFHNFTIDVIESFTRDPIMPNDELIRILDQKEIYYIEKYKAYTEGYNCTVGGDYGVLGLKMAEEQRKKVSQNTKELVAKGVFGKRVYMYNFIEKYYITAWTIKDAENITKLSRGNISKLCNNCYIRPYCKNFIAAFSNEELENKKKECVKYLEDINNRNTNIRRANGTFYKGNSNWYKGMTSLNKGKSMSSEQKNKIRESNIKYLVYQYDLDGNLIAIHNSIRDSSVAVNADYNSIRKACSGKARTCKGYVWEKKLKQYDCKHAV